MKTFLIRAVALLGAVAACGSPGTQTEERVNVPASSIGQVTSAIERPCDGVCRRGEICRVLYNTRYEAKVECISGSTGAVSATRPNHNDTSFCRYACESFESCVIRGTDGHALCISGDYDTSRDTCGIAFQQGFCPHEVICNRRGPHRYFCG
jgi:hypothetical protein